jgi:hypothetical protein
MPLEWLLRENVILVAVTSIRFIRTTALFVVPPEIVGFASGQSYRLINLLTDPNYTWSNRNYLRLDPVWPRATISTALTVISQTRTMTARRFAAWMSSEPFGQVSNGIKRGSGPSALGHRVIGLAAKVRHAVLREPLTELGVEDLAAFLSAGRSPGAFATTIEEYSIDVTPG